MPGIQWTTPAQREWVLKHLPEYIAAGNVKNPKKNTSKAKKGAKKGYENGKGGARSRFYAKFYRGWFQQWPVVADLVAQRKLSPELKGVEGSQLPEESQREMYKHALQKKKDVSPHSFA